MTFSNMIMRTVAAAAMAVLCGHVSAAPPQPAEETASEVAHSLAATRSAWLECVRAAIPKLDQPESASQAVARAAMDQCMAPYTQLLQAVSRSLGSTCPADSDCARRALKNAQSEAAHSATEEVVSARIRVAGDRVLECQ